MSDTATVLSDTALHFHRHGYAVVRAAVDRPAIDALQHIDVAALLALQDDPRFRDRLKFRDSPTQGRMVTKIDGAIELSPAFGALVRHPRLCALARELLGEDPVLFKDKFILKAPGSGDGFAPHQDMSYGFNRFISGGLSFMIAIDAADAANGCLQVAPGRIASQLMGPLEGPLPSGFIPEHEWVSCPLAVGDVVVFDAFLPHRSAANTSERYRRVYITTYNRASDGDLYQPYYAWKHAWDAHQRAGGRRSDFAGDPPRLPRTDLRAVARPELLGTLS